MPIVNSRQIGIIQVLLSGTCFGFLGLFGKEAYARGMTPGELLSLRFLFAAALLGAYFLATQPRRLRLGRGATVKSLLLGALGYAIFSSCYFYALTGLSASLTVLLLYMYPVIVAIASWILFGERIERAKWIALPLVMAGLAMLIWGDMKITSPLALLFGVGSAVFYALYIIASSRWLREVDTLAAVVYIQLGAGVTLAALNWREASRVLGLVTESWLLILGMAVVCTIAAMSLLLAGLKKLKNWEVSILSTGEPVMGIAMAMIFLGEAFSVVQGIGAVAVLAAFIIVAL